MSQEFRLSTVGNGLSYPRDRRGSAEKTQGLFSLVVDAAWSAGVSTNAFAGSVSFRTAWDPQGRLAADMAAPSSRVSQLTK